MKRQPEGSGAARHGADKGAPRLRDILWKLFRRHFFLYTLICAVLFCGLCTRSYIGQLSYASTLVSMNYAEAARGLAPNQTRFNMYDFRSNALMQRVIELAALTDVEPWELARCVSISTRGGGSGDYISTGYTLSVDIDPLVKNGHDVSIDARSLLHLISKAYTQIFYEDCVSRADVLLYADPTTRPLEHRELSDYYALKLQILDQYAAGRVLENSVFVSETTGLSFKDIQSRVGNLRAVDLAKINAYVNTTGITVNTDNYLAKLAYINYRNSEAYQKNLSQYGVRLANIAYYDILQSAVVMVPTYDTTGEFYMSMTKTGSDDIAEGAQYWNEMSAAVMADIDTTDKTIANILASQNLASDHEIAKAMLDQLEEEISELTRLTLLTDSDYVAYKTDNYITFTDSWPGALDKTNFVKNAALTLLLYAALWLLAWWQMARKERTL